MNELFKASNTDIFSESIPLAKQLILHTYTEKE